MTDWLILASVKILKTAILAAVSLVSTIATGIHPDCPPDTTQVTLMPPPAAVPRAPDPAESVHRAIPPVRVEMTFTPDLLRPPTRDLSL